MVTIRVRLDPATLQLVGLPNRVPRSDWDDILWPPCPACGRRIEVECIEVGTLADHPDEYPVMAGRWTCPSGCDPRYPRVVVASDYRSFTRVCHDREWNPARVLYVNAYGAPGSGGMQVIRGLKLIPKMITVAPGTYLAPEVEASLKWSMVPGKTWNPYPEGDTP